MKPKKLLSFILVTAMTISLLSIFAMTVLADEAGTSTTTATEKNIVLGTAALSGYDSVNNSYKYIYYGTYNSSPIKWRILTMNGNDGTSYYDSTPYKPTTTPDNPVDGTVYTDFDGVTQFIYIANNKAYYKKTTSTPMFLLSEYALKQMAYDADGAANENQVKSCNWRYSDVWNWCNNISNADSFIYSSFTSDERNYLLKTSKRNGYFGDYTDELKGDTFFFLSYNEVQKDYIKNNSDTTLTSGVNVGWWLRSPAPNTPGSDSVKVVNGANVDLNFVHSESPAVRPAFNLNMSSVLFTSAAVGGKKTDNVGTIEKNTDYAGKEYKLTLLDSEREFIVDELPMIPRVGIGGTFKFGFHNAKKGENEYISVMLVKDGAVAYYGHASVGQSGEFASFTVPDDIAVGTYELYIFNEQINGDYKTDYSSAFRKFTLSVEKPKATFATEPTANTLTYNCTNQELATKGTSSEGTVKYSLEKNGVYTTDIPTGKNVGTYTVWYYIEADDNHTDSDIKNIEVTISQKDIADTTITLSNMLIYNGTSQTQTISITDNGTVLKGQMFNPEIEVDLSRDYTVYSYTGTNASDYYLKIKGNGNYTATVYFPFKIAPCPVVIEWKNTDGLIYDGNSKTVTAEVSNKYGTDEVNLTFSDDSDNLTQTEKGLYTAKVTAVDNNNYTIVGGQNLTQKWSIIQAKDNEITGLSLKGWTYGDNANTPISSAIYGEPAYSYSTDKDGTYTDTVPTNAGTYWVKATVAGTDNYAEVSSDPVLFVITKANSSVTTAPTKAENLVYTGDKLALITADGVAKGGTIKYSVDGENFIYDFADIPKAINAKDDYKVWYKVVGDNNHNDTMAVCIEIKVAKKPINTKIALTAPVKNATPQTNIETDEYTATIVWSPTVEVNGIFAKSTQYTATITVTPKANYTTDSVTEYVIDSAESVTLNADGTVTAVFEQTAGGSGSGISGGSGGSGGSTTTTYTVTFKTNGADKLDDVKVVKNNKLPKPTVPTKDGYIFDGWYTDSELTDEYDFDTKVTKNITLYAKWIEDEIQEEPSDDKKDDEPKTDDWKNPFTDVSEFDWFFDNVRYANKNGLMSGVTNTTFAPNDSLTRAMLVTVIWRAEGEPVVNYAMPFTDIVENAYYIEALRWAASENIVSGVTTTEFAPDEKITREQIAAIVYRYAQYKGYDVFVGEDTNILSYTDFEEISEYAIEAMQYAVGIGLIKGKTESTLNPKDNATRAEIAAILQRFIEANNQNADVPHL